jgi:hypothetical protein
VFDIRTQPWLTAFGCAGESMGEVDERPVPPLLGKPCGKD